MSTLNIPNRSIFCHDNLEVLRGINSECIDLIYLDPPFNKKKQFTAPVGSSAEGASFSDIFREEDMKDEWVDSIRYENHELHSYLSGVKAFSSKYNYCYLVYMAIRLLECHRVLKSTGSIYLHCDPTMSHHLKIVMDCVFGESNFRNEIVWHYDTGGVPKSKYSSKHDILLFYTKADKWVFNSEAVKIPRTEKSMKRASNPKGARIQESNTHKHPTDVFIVPQMNPMAIERVGYPTQKPLALLERIIKASSNEGDVVLDPFCGCATACVAAESLGRRWSGIDVSIKAYEQVKKRLAGGVKRQLVPQNDLDYESLVEFSTVPPTRTDTTEHLPKGYVYIISNPSYGGEYKVGIAKDAEARLRGYQTSDPNRAYKLEFKYLTPHYMEIEKYIHTAFRSRHEWVRADLDALKSAITGYTPS